MWPHLLAVWFVFFATLGIYPAVLLGIEPSSAIDRESFLAQYWPQLTVFFLFSSTAFVGNLLATWGPRYPRFFGPTSFWYSSLRIPQYTLILHIHSTYCALKELHVLIFHKSLDENLSLFRLCKYPCATMQVSMRATAQF